MPEKPDLEDDMLTIEDDEVEFPKVAKVSEVPATKNSSNHDIQTTKPAVAETIAKDSSKETVKAVSEAITKVTSDRAAASPPCEVSSTTINNEIEKEKGGNKDKSQGTTSSTVETENNQAKAKNITTEVIAETSETVEIEGADPTQDEEEIDDDEDAAEMENNTDESAKKSNEKVTSKAGKISLSIANT